MESKALRELSALYLDSVCGEKMRSESRLDKEPPSQFEKGDDDRGNPDYMKTSSLKDEEKWKRLQNMRKKSKKDSVRAKAEETDQLGLYNSLIESGKFSDEEIEKIVEAQAARNDPEKYERDQEEKDTRSKKQKRMDDPDIGINSPAFKKFMQQMNESGKFTEEEIQFIVDEAFKALTPDDKDRIRNQAERRKKSADRAQNASDYKTSTKQDQEVRNMKAVVS
jgi:hypothetical protein